MVLGRCFVFGFLDPEGGSPSSISPGAPLDSSSRAAVRPALLYQDP